MPRRGRSRGYDATNARESRESGSQVIEAELIDDEVRPVDDFVTRAAGVGRSFVEDIASARALVNEAGLGAITAPSNITLSFGAAAGVAGAVALIGGLAGWYLRGQSTRRRRAR